MIGGHFEKKSFLQVYSKQMHLTGGDRKSQKTVDAFQSKQGELLPCDSAHLV
jgi:hypothetical protein